MRVLENLAFQEKLMNNMKLQQICIQNKIRSVVLVVYGLEKGKDLHQVYFQSQFRPTLKKRRNKIKQTKIFLFDLQNNNVEFFVDVGKNIPNWYHISIISL